jgi:Transposase, Mutator family
MAKAQLAILLPWRDENRPYTEFLTVSTVSAFFQDMRGRGFGDPLLVVSDGAFGIIKAIETCFPRSARQRCLAHRMRNVAAKVPEDLWSDFKATDSPERFHTVWSIFETARHSPCPPARYCPTYWSADPGPMLCTRPLSSLRAVAPFCRH